MVLKSLNLGIRFILEILALVALGYWGFTTGRGWGLKLLFGLGAPILAAVLWANFGAPAAVHRLSGLSRLLLELLIFGGATLGLLLAGQRTLGLIFGAIFVVNEILLFLWGQH